MASRADNVASNLSLANFSKATELKNRIWFTIGALIVFRFLSFVPLPGVKTDAKHVQATDKCGYKMNRELAGLIKKAMQAKKGSDKKLLGDDDGCFPRALWAVRTFGGVLEHPWQSRAWPYFGLTVPPRTGRWVKADDWGGWTCCVEQRPYGHHARKPTMLYAVGCELRRKTHKLAQKLFTLFFQRPAICTQNPAQKRAVGLLVHRSLSTTDVLRSGLFALLRFSQPSKLYCTI